MILAQNKTIILFVLVIFGLTYIGAINNQKYQDSMNNEYVSADISQKVSNI